MQLTAHRCGYVRARDVTVNRGKFAYQMQPDKRPADDRSWLTSINQHRWAYAIRALLDNNTCSMQKGGEGRAGEPDCLLHR